MSTRKSKAIPGLANIARQYHARRFVLEGAIAILKSNHGGDSGLHKDICSMGEKILRQLKNRYVYESNKVKDAQPRPV